MLSATRNIKNLGKTLIKDRNYKQRQGSEIYKPLIMKSV